MIVTDRIALRPVRVGVEIAAALQQDVRRAVSSSRRRAPVRLASEGITRIRAGDDPASIAASWAAAESRWRLLRNRYLLYR